MIDREVLAVALEKPWPVHWEKNSIIAAATKYLAQLPENCDECQGTGEIENVVYLGVGPMIGCPSCHGSGRVYPAELVERIAAAINGSDPAQLGPRYLDVMMTRAVAVLDALNGTADG